MRAGLLLLAALAGLATTAGVGAGVRGGGAGVRGAGAGVRGAGAGVRGAGPRFARRQRTALVAAVGQGAALVCRVAALGDRTVSWVRSRDLQILSYAGVVFTVDPRVSIPKISQTPAGTGEPGAEEPWPGEDEPWPGEDGPWLAEDGPGWPAPAPVPVPDEPGVSRHELRIAALRVADTGRYECQVNTEPKLSLFFNLTVIDEPVPRVEVRAEAREVVAAEGGDVTLACEARYRPAPGALPAPPLRLRWERGGRPLRGGQTGGGAGVSLEVSRWAARAVSRVTLAGVRRGDAGEYACRAGGAGGAVTLRVLPEERSEMQRDEAAGRAARAGGGGGAGLAGLAAMAGLLRGAGRL